MQFNRDEITRRIRELTLAAVALIGAMPVASAEGLAPLASQAIEVAASSSSENPRQPLVLSQASTHDVILAGNRFHASHRSHVSHRSHYSSRG